MGMRPITSLMLDHQYLNPRAEAPAVSLYVERRSHPRLPVLDGSLPGEIRLAGTNHIIEAGAINISANSLGIWLAEPILPYGQLELMLPMPFGPLPFTVTNCRQDTKHDSRWLCGLRLSPNRVENVIEIFLRFGCIVGT